MTWRDPFEGAPFVAHDRVTPCEHAEYPGRSEDRPTGIIRIHLSAWCGNCDEWLHLESKRKRMAAAEAKHHGWKFTRARGWLCPNCAAAPDPGCGRPR
jgi:thiamine biosynthesis protein ThiC